MRARKRDCVSLCARAVRKRFQMRLPTPTPQRDLVLASMHPLPMPTMQSNATHALQPTLPILPPSIHEQPDGRAAGRASHSREPSKPSEQVGGAPANSTGARRLECKWQAPAWDSGLATRDAPEPETPFFGLFLFSLLSSATCALSDHLPMNVRGRLVSARANVWVVTYRRRSSMHTCGMRSHEQARTHPELPQGPCTPKKTRWIGRKRARLAEDELDRTSV